MNYEHGTTKPKMTGICHSGIKGLLQFPDGHIEEEWTTEGTWMARGWCPVCDTLDNIGIVVEWKHGSKEFCDNERHSCYIEYYYCWNCSNKVDYW